MRIRSVTLEGFQCFSSPTVIELDRLTTLIGANGCGKSAALEALCRMFGVTSASRQLRKSDFHVPANKQTEDFNELSLSVETVLEFPELEGAQPEGAAVPECFNQMLVAVAGETPICRLRLEAKWHKTSLAEGEIEESLSWITTAGEPTADDRKSVRPHERSRIHVHYVPAIRDPVRQLKQASGTILSRLLLGTNWSEKAKQAITAASDSVTQTFRSEAAVKLIEDEVGQTWKTLQQFPELAAVQLHPLESRIEDLLRHVDVRFSDAKGASSLEPERLSDGLRSLFYFSLLTASFRVEQTASREAAEAKDGQVKTFSEEAITAPTLTLFAVEEPENHLAAHYLGRIVQLLDEVTADSAAQVILTSHSPAILGRVDPAHVRHLRLEESLRTTTVKKIQLPSGEGEAFKYVKEAVRAYPELYFARLVVLGEGDSEQLVLHRLAEAMGLGADAHAMAIVPLGGRYVNHMWKLLNDLAIPHVTLLDLDRERDGGAWGRIKYACAELVSNGVAREQLYTVGDGTTEQVLTTDEVEKMHTWNVMPSSSLDGWLTMLEAHSVFFCSPLDLDFLMLTTFPAEYQATGKRGPQIPTEGTPKYAEKLQNALTATLKGNNSGGGTYSEAEKKLFIWYAYLFLGQGKPTTHILGLNAIGAAALLQKCPALLQRLMKRVREKLAGRA